MLVLGNGVPLPTAQSLAPYGMGQGRHQDAALEEEGSAHCLLSGERQPGLVTGFRGLFLRWHLLPCQVSTQVCGFCGATEDPHP